MLDRLPMRVLAQRRLGGETPIVDGAREVAALLEVHGELAGDLRRARTVGALEAITDAEMQAEAMPGRDPLVEHRPVERVDEREPSGDGAVRPLRGARGAHEPPAPGHLGAAPFSLGCADAV